MDDLQLVGLGVGAAVVLAIAAILVERVLHGALVRLARRRGSGLDELVARHIRRPVRTLLVLLALVPLLPWLAANDRDPDLLARALLILGILAVGWLLIKALAAVRDLVEQRLPDDASAAAAASARTVRTQVGILHRLGALVIGIVAVALALLTIPGVQPLAASLLASAGILGIVVGVAAGPVIGNLLAGIQIALSQPLRLGDVVVFDGEWARVEEVTTTFVLLRSWDGRRLVVPLSRVIGATFENWTRHSVDLLTTFTLHVDFHAPVEAIRARVGEILEGTDLWDRRAWNVQVVDLTERTIVLRVLMSVANGSVAWDLRCLVREGLVTWLAETHPTALPFVRERHEAAGPAPAEPAPADPAPATSRRRRSP
jgi:small-conductance mechanosensitive channel